MHTVVYMMFTFIYSYTFNYTNGINFCTRQKFIFTIIGVDGNRPVRIKSSQKFIFTIIGVDGNRPFRIKLIRRARGISKSVSDEIRYFVKVGVLVPLQKPGSY